MLSNMSSSSLSLDYKSLPTSMKSSDVHSFFFGFEDSVTLYEWQEWCSDRWLWPVVAVPVYLTAIALGQKAMKDRKAFDLRKGLFAWNAALALFSAIGVVRLVTAVSLQVRDFGLKDSICVNRPDNVVSLWIFLFTASKLAELGDTAFLVLRKRAVLLLHWFHHTTVLLYTWYAFTANAPTGKYFILMNYTVHSIMYAYFACQSVGIRAPRFLSMAITCLQLLQMVGGIAVLLSSIVFYYQDEGFCNVRTGVIVSGSAMYASYFALFAHFFLKAYVWPKGAPKTAATTGTPDVSETHVKSQ